MELTKSKFCFMVTKMTIPFVKVDYDFKAQQKKDDLDMTDTMITTLEYTLGRYERDENHASRHSHVLDKFLILADFGCAAFEVKMRMKELPDDLCKRGRKVFSQLRDMLHDLDDWVKNSSIEEEEEEDNFGSNLMKTIQAGYEEAAKEAQQQLDAASEDESESESGNEKGGKNESSLPPLPTPPPGLTGPVNSNSSPYCAKHNPHGTKNSKEEPIKE